MIIVTAGNKYLDIDAYASCIAYVHLLNNTGRKAMFCSSAITNASVPNHLIVQEYTHTTNYTPTSDDTYIILDVSNPEFIDRIVNPDNIEEIIDHHLGHESYWSDRGTNCRVEFIGSVATIIYEKYIEANRTDLLNPYICSLLTAAILDNTLNLNSTITSPRDIEAYKELKKIGNLDIDFDKNYFLSCQQGINDNVVLSIKNDIKQEYVSDLLPTIFGQVTVYDTDPIFEEIQQIEKLFNEFEKPWLLNIICIQDGKSYIYTSNKIAKENLTKLFDASFIENTLTLDKFMLRKEIMKFARAKQQKSLTIK